MNTLTAPGEIDLYLFGEGRHRRLWEMLGAQPLPEGGTRFAVWAPNAEGAQVVQVNHPRATSQGIGSFQQNFDRAGLSFDFGARAFGGNPSVAPLTALALGLAEDAPLFSDKFDAVEIYNGYHLAAHLAIHRLGVGHGVDGEALLPEIALEQVAQSQVVVHHEDLRAHLGHCRHGSG